MATSRHIELQSGQRFGRLAVLTWDAERRRWRCRCDCGNDSLVSGSHLWDGSTKSCGCLKQETKSRRTHGRSQTTEYRIWNGIRQRCENPRRRFYPAYGGRGIAVCEHWKSFANFYADMGPRPSARHTIERVDNSGNYEPTNCVWATRTNQARNRRSNRLVIFGGESRTLAEWVELADLPYPTVWARLLKGWPIARALITPVRRAA